MLFFTISIGSASQRHTPIQSPFSPLSPHSAIYPSEMHHTSIVPPSYLINECRWYCQLGLTLADSPSPIHTLVRPLGVLVSLVHDNLKYISLHFFLITWKHYLDHHVQCVNVQLQFYYDVVWLRPSIVLEQGQPCKTNFETLSILWT